MSRVQRRGKAFRGEQPTMSAAYKEKPPKMPPSSTAPGVVFLFEKGRRRGRVKTFLHFWITRAVSNLKQTNLASGPYHLHAFRGFVIGERSRYICF